MTEDQLELLRDKYVLWERGSRAGNPDMRDYDRRAAEALKALLSEHQDGLNALTASLTRAERMEGALRISQTIPGLMAEIAELEQYGSGRDDKKFLNAHRKELKAAIATARNALSPPPSPQDLGSACSDRERTGTPAPPTSGPSDLDGDV